MFENGLHLFENKDIIISENGLFSRDTLNGVSTIFFITTGIWRRMFAFILVNRLNNKGFKRVNSSMYYSCFILLLYRSICDKI